MSLSSVLQSYKDFYGFTPVKSSEIDTAEKQLQTKFALDFRELISNFGAISVNGHELTGICNAKRLDVISITIEEREMNQKISKDFYVIEYTNIDKIIVWQNLTGKIYCSTPNSAPTMIFDTLKEYLLSD